MSDRDPESDWEQPRVEFGRGGGPHYSGGPPFDANHPLAASSWTRNKRVIISALASFIIFVAGLVVFIATTA